MSLSSAEKGEPRSVYVTYTEPALIKEALEALTKVRSAGIRADIGLRSKGLRKQLEDASSMGFRWVLIVGRKELDSGNVLLKDLRDGSEKLLPREDYLDAILSVS
jgi:histidyl-tRNA synthetase